MKQIIASFPSFTARIKMINLWRTSIKKSNLVLQNHNFSHQLIQE